MLKRKLVNISDDSANLVGTDAYYNGEETFDFIAGRNSGERVHNVKGCQVTGDLVLAQVHHSQSYVIALRSGERWLRVGSISPSGDFIKQLAEQNKLTIKGPSPLQIEQRERAEAEAKAAIVAGEERQAQARKRIQERQEREAQKRQ